VPQPLPTGPRTGCIWSPLPGDQPLFGDSYNVSRLLRDGDGRTARFKYLAPNRPSVELYSFGIEWIAFALGTAIGVPVAPVYLEQYSGVAGALSPLIPNSMDWHAFRQQSEKTRPISNLTILPLCVVFDVWIANCDRWDKNLLVQASPVGVTVPEASELSVWLIDHGVSFLWPPVKYGLKEDGSDLSKAVIDNGDTEAERFIRDRMVDGRVTRGYWGSLSRLAAEERTKLYGVIKEIDDGLIEAVAKEVPGAYIDQSLLELTVQQIKARRDRVDQIVERLLL
jgi:hypothetical protein